MFERKLSPDLSQNQLAKICLTTQSGQPVEFIYQGVRFHISAVLNSIGRWRLRQLAHLPPLRSSLIKVITLGRLGQALEANKNG
jgi:hypothetical protein